MALGAHVVRAYHLEPLAENQGIAQIGGVVQTLPKGIRVQVRPLA
jgi:hypothetical protein